VDVDLAHRREWRILLRDMKHAPAMLAHSNEVISAEALIGNTDRDPLDILLRRTRALIHDLEVSPRPPDLHNAIQRLSDLTAEAERTSVGNTEQRLEIFLRVAGVRRQVAFSNPLLDFKDLVFITRRRALYDHMCDQFYGITARPGGRLCLLKDAFGSSPAVVDVLEHSIVEKGRLTGSKLWGGPCRDWNTQYSIKGELLGERTEGGAFLSPELSWDGKSLLFAYVECTGDGHHQTHTDSTRGHWDAGRCYHIFKVNIDGTGLVQLTDGTWNDFDPCWLPNGPACFDSVRAKGFKPSLNNRPL
jgi:hypothetical protein